jgi:hypothetical protein
MRAPHKAAHFSEQQRREAVKNFPMRKSKSFATISEAMHRHLD